MLLVKNRIANGKICLTDRTAIRACGATKAIFLQGMAANVVVRSKRLCPFGTKKGLPQKESPRKTHTYAKIRYIRRSARGMSHLYVPQSHPKAHRAVRKHITPPTERQLPFVFADNLPQNPFVRQPMQTRFLHVTARLFVETYFQKFLSRKGRQTKTRAARQKTVVIAASHYAQQKGSAKRSPFERSTSHKNNSKKQYTSTAAGKKATLPPTKATSRFVLL